mgnify:FL=1
MATITYPRTDQADQVVSGRSPRRKRRQWAPYLFLVIPLALYFTWIIGPTIATGVLSATNWDGVSALHFSDKNGTSYLVQNFQRLFVDSNFWTALSDNIKWLLFFLIIPTSMGLAMAMIFNGKFRGSRVFKIAFYSPLVLAGVVTGLIWSAMYNPSSGLINSFLRIFTGTESGLPL